jgi:hypothetical protein
MAERSTDRLAHGQTFLENWQWARVVARQQHVISIRLLHFELGIVAQRSAIDSFKLTASAHLQYKCSVLAFHQNEIRFLHEVEFHIVDRELS